MPKAAKKTTSTKKGTRKLGESSSRQENQMIALAKKCARKQLEEGTASPSVITHYLRKEMMREKDELELEKLRNENKLLKAKTEAIESAKNIEELYRDAMDAFKGYRSSSDD